MYLDPAASVIPSLTELISARDLSRLDRQGLPLLRLQEGNFQPRSPSGSASLKEAVERVEFELVRDADGSAPGQQEAGGQGSRDLAFLSLQEARTIRRDAMRMDPGLFRSTRRTRRSFRKPHGCYLTSGHSLSDSGRKASSAGIVATTFIRSHSPFDSAGVFA